MGLFKRNPPAPDSDTLDSIIKMSSIPFVRGTLKASMEKSIKGSCKDNLKNYTKQGKEITPESLTAAMFADEKYMEACHFLEITDEYILDVAMATIKGSKD